MPDGISQKLDIAEMEIIGFNTVEMNVNEWSKWSQSNLYVLMLLMNMK